MSTADDTPNPARRPPRGNVATGTPPPPPPADIEVEEESPPPPPDPDSLRGLFQDPGVRNYLFAGLAGLAMVFVVLFSEGTDPIAGGLVVVLGAAGLVLRWPAAPAFVLLVLTYLLVFPFVFPKPDLLSSDPDRPAGERFLIVHLLLVASVLVYLKCQYRLFGLTWQAVPFDTKFPRKGEKPYRRPPGLILPGEIARMLYLTAGVVVAGQLAWWFVTGVEPDVGADFPLKAARARLTFQGEPGRMSPVASRFVVLAGLVFFGILLARLVFGYWRLRTMRPAEAGMLLQDTGWSEAHRERVRVAKWRARAWRRAKDAERANEAGRPGRGGRR